MLVKLSQPARKLAIALLLVPAMFAPSVPARSDTLPVIAGTESAISLGAMLDSLSAAWDVASTFAGCATNPWVMEGNRTAIDPILLYSMALTESRTLWDDGLVRPCPWCIRIDGVLHRAGSKAEAQRLARDAMASGRDITDVGVMQVNARAHSKRVNGDIAALVDVGTNIRVGADILREALDSTTDFERGLGRYHSWTARLGEPYGRVASRRYRELVEHSRGDLWANCNQFSLIASTAKSANSIDGSSM